MSGPMKALDASGLVAWTGPDRYAGIENLLNPAWVAEPKIDGCRMQVMFGPGANRVIAGSRDYSGQFPHLRDLDRPDLYGTVLDGEMTYLGGMATRLMNSNPDRAALAQKHNGWATFHAFDVHMANGRDVSQRTYADRRMLLELVTTAAASRHIRLVESLPATAEAIDAALAQGLEGVVLKRRDSRVQAGVRSPDWRKVKRTMTGDFFIIGSKPGEGSNRGRVGSLKVAYWDDETQLPVHVGDVGSGLTDRMRTELTDPTTGGVRRAWMGRVVEVAAQEVTPDGVLRHPRFVRVRGDKTALDCGPEQINGFHLMRGVNA
jgi:bifunctional non-homologous end joining protein LigD